LKLGAQGALIFTELDGMVQIENLPALNVNRVVDPSGAGDSILALATLTLCASSDIFLAAYLGSLAAGIQVTQRGNIPLTQDFWKN
jgi:sugar/nucleoside kinase (ribokinase family)